MSAHVNITITTSRLIQGSTLYCNARHVHPRFKHMQFGLMLLPQRPSIHCLQALYLPIEQADNKLVLARALHCSMLQPSLQLSNPSISLHQQNITLHMPLLQEMDGIDCEGRFLGVKLDKYSFPATTNDGPDDMSTDRRPSRARAERSSRSSASHKGRQVSP